MADQIEEPEHQVRKQVVYETVSRTSTKSTAITIGFVVVIALSLIIWILMQMR